MQKGRRTGTHSEVGGYKGGSANSLRLVADSAPPGDNWAVPANFQSPTSQPVVQKPDLSHLGLDGLPVARPKSQSRSQSATPPTSQPKSSRPGSGGAPQPQPAMYIPPGEGAYSQPQRTSSRSRSASQHPMHAAVPDVSPRQNSSRHEQQPPQFGMQAVTPDASPRRSHRSMSRSATPEAVSYTHLTLPTTPYV